MTGFEIAGGFATLVALIGQYKQERKEAKDVDEKKFLEWLATHRHQEIINSIVNNAALQTEVSNLLRHDTQSILQKLDEVFKVLASVASQFDEFRGMTHAAVGTDQDSQTAFGIIRGLVRAGWRRFQVQRHGKNWQFIVIEGEPGAADFEIDENYLQEDVEKLVAMGFLRRDYTPSAKEIYSITRAGDRFASKTDK